MSFGLIWHPDIALHDLHAAHAAMDPRRIERVTQALLAIPGLTAELAPLASLDQLLRVHDADYLQVLMESQRLVGSQRVRLAPDTELNGHTWNALLRSAGAACQAVDAVVDGRLSGAFCPVYAGHHAQRDGADGFCFVNTALVAVAQAKARGVERVAVLDFDVHSGNGTVLGLLGQPGVLFAETYQPGYPGAFMQRISRPAHILRKKCVNRGEFRRAWTGLFQELQAWHPDLVVVSAGFDAHRADPLGTMALGDADYGWLATNLISLAAPVVGLLEGGYSVPDVARCAELFVRELARLPAGAIRLQD